MSDLLAWFFVLVLRYFTWLAVLLAGVAFVVVVLVHRAAAAGRADALPLRAMLLRALPGTTAAVIVLSLLAIEHGCLVRGADGAPSFRLVELLGSPSTGSGILGERDPEVRPGEAEAEEAAPIAEPQPLPPLPGAVLIALAALLAGALDRDAGRCIVSRAGWAGGAPSVAAESTWPYVRDTCFSPRSLSS